MLTSKLVILLEIRSKSIIRETKVQMLKKLLEYKRIYIDKYLKTINKFLF